MGIRSVAVLVRALAVGAAVMAGGCGTWPKDLTVRLDPSTQEAGMYPSVDVHLIGVRRAELQRLKKESVSGYWSPSGASRQPMEARKELFLGPAATSRTISRNDAVWKLWDGKDRPYLLVLADLRGVSDPSAGGDDPRRVVLPLDKDRWPAGTKEIRLSVQRDRIQVETPPKPKQ
jgi:hypothetical protein